MFVIMIIFFLLLSLLLFIVTFIDKTDPSDWLKRKEYWRHTLKIRATFELNIEGSVYRFITNFFSIYIFIGLVRFEEKIFRYISIS